MPELPEVYTIVSDLNKHISGCDIIDVKVVGTYKVFPDKNTFIQNLQATRINKVFRIAKNIIFELSNEKQLLIHLAMTGQLLLQNRPVRWERVVLKISKQASNEKQTLKFCDMRMFGKIAVIEKPQLELLRKKYGPEPLQENIDSKELLKNLQSRRTTIKNALLEQELIAGLGNIYATDTLFLAKIHPETSTKDLTINMVQDIIQNARLILLEGIKHRGSTLQDKMYVDIFGKEGLHQNYFRIYGKKACPECKNTVEFVKINGRGTYFCPICQPKGGQNKLL